MGALKRGGGWNPLGNYGFVWKSKVRDNWITETSKAFIITVKVSEGKVAKNYNYLLSLMELQTMHVFQTSGFYPSTVIYSCFSSKIPFLYCLLSSLHELSSWSAPKAKYLKFRSPDCWKMYFWYCRNIACTLLINMIFYVNISWECFHFYHVCLNGKMSAATVVFGGILEFWEFQK